MDQTTMPTALSENQRRYNQHRPHRARNQLPPSAHEQPATVHNLEGRSLLRTQVLGGAINEYSRCTS
ncbi:hypothetical protein ACFWVU_00985 [Streptomyces sp. NPDC058686]|uniref:hypothetical protein n=1 Tax=Streptomyces sp. NPDC058686 TaxID=3346599 RepID=UPI00365E119C